MNCWEFVNCERQPGGARVGELGICPVTVDEELDGTYGGIAAGRVCWAVVGSFCGGKIQGTYAEKLRDCTKCAFMALVKREESLTPLGFSIQRREIERSSQGSNIKNIIRSAT
jgi:hypothetical protein